jgi:tetratricopeptide (TPR) repeat protein
MSFASAAKNNPAAADLLRICAFLAPDAIPEQVFTEGGKELGEVLATTCADADTWTKAVAEAGRFSLIRRNTAQNTLEMHRLVQDVLRDEIDAPVRCLWAGRVVQALNATFPDPEFENWQECEQLLPHARVAARHVADYGLDSVDAAGLLDWTGTYLRWRAQYAEAEPLLKRALAIVEKTLGPDDTRTTTCLTRLAGLYYYQGRYEEAEPLLKRACHNDENRDADETAGAIGTLAAIYEKQGRHGEAETIYQNALDIKEKALGPNHPHVATCLNNLAMVYQGQDRYEEAEPLLKRAIRIRQLTLGPDHPDTAQALKNLAILYFHNGRYAEAQALVQGALAVYERTLGPDHPDTAQALNDLAVLYEKQGRHGEAETIYQNALDIKEKALGPNHPALAVTLWNLALLYENQGRYGEAESLIRRSCHIYEQALGPTHEETQKSIKCHARLLRKVPRDRGRQLRVLNPELR